MVSRPQPRWPSQLAFSMSSEPQILRLRHKPAARALLLLLPMQLLVVLLLSPISYTAAARVMLGRSYTSTEVDSVCVGVDVSLAMMQGLYGFSGEAALEDGSLVCADTVASPSNARFLYVGLKSDLAVHRCASSNDIQLYYPTLDLSQKFQPVTSLPGDAAKMQYVATVWDPRERVCGAGPLEVVDDDTGAQVELIIVNGVDQLWSVSTTTDDDPLYTANDTSTESRPLDYADLNLTSLDMLKDYFTIVLSKPDFYNQTDTTRLYGAMLMNQATGMVAYVSYAFGDDSRCDFNLKEEEEGVSSCVLADVFEAGYNVSGIEWPAVYNSRRLLSSRKLVSVADHLLASRRLLQQRREGEPTEVEEDERFVSEAAGLGLSPRQLRGRRLGSARVVTTSNLAVTTIICTLPTTDGCDGGACQADCRSAVASESYVQA